MSTERGWKPGDVAMRYFDGKSSVSMVSECGQHMSGGPHWHHSDGGWDLLECVSTPIMSMATYRPLVVIDPEDREAVERLWTAAANPLNVFTAALREFADPKPPKPEEPMGLGAVVEDAKGKRYSRVDGDDAFPWVKSPVDSETVQCFGWHEIDAVKVLSEGVTA